MASLISYLFPSRKIEDIPLAQLEKEVEGILEFPVQSQSNWAFGSTITSSTWMGGGELYVPHWTFTYWGSLLGGQSATAHRIEEVSLEIFRRYEEEGIDARKLERLEALEDALHVIHSCYDKAPIFKNTLSPLIDNLRVKIDEATQRAQPPVQLIDKSQQEALRYDLSQYTPNRFADPDLFKVTSACFEREDSLFVVIRTGTQGEVIEAKVTATPPKTNDNIGALNFLNTVLGEKRLERICARPYLGISLKSLKEMKTPLTVGILKKILIDASLVRMEDVEELVVEMTTCSEVRYLGKIIEGKEEIKALGNKLQVATEPLKKVEMDLLISILVPGTLPHHMFLGDIPEVDPKAYDSGKREQGHRELAWIQSHLRCRTSQNTSDWAITTGELIADREPAEGVLLVHPFGFHEVLNPIVKGGAFIIPLKAVTTRGPKFRSLLLCRGSRRTKLAVEREKSWKENVRHDLGAKGVMESYDSIETLIAFPDSGFVGDVKERFWSFGSRGLGGSHASRIAAIYLNRVSKLITVNGCGVDVKTGEIFAKAINGGEEKMAITHFVDKENCIPFFGGIPLGMGCPNSHVIFNYVVNEQFESIRDPLIKKPLDMARHYGNFPGGRKVVIKDIVASLENPYIGKRFERPWRFHILNNQQNPAYFARFSDRIKQVSSSWEALRPKLLGHEGEFYSWIRLHIYLRHFGSAF